MSWGDFLGTKNISSKQDYYFIPFEQAREFVRKLGLETYGNGVSIVNLKKNLWIFLLNLKITTKIKVGSILEIGLEQLIYHLNRQENL